MSGVAVANEADHRVAEGGSLTLGEGFCRTFDVLKRGSSAIREQGSSCDEEMPQAKAKVCHVGRPRVELPSGWA